MAGAEYEDLEVASETGTNWLERTDISLYYTDTEQMNGRFHNRSPAAYLQDSWRLGDRFTVNAGLRWSGQFFTGFSWPMHMHCPMPTHSHRPSPCPYSISAAVA